MKKSLKIAFASLALIPCAALFVGCGQDQLATKAQVNTVGDYQKSSTEQFNTYTSDADTSTTLTGYRFTIEAKSKTTYASQTVESDVLLNGIIKSSGTNLEAALRMTMQGQVLMTTYIKDGFIYADSSLLNMKYKQALTTDDIFGEMDKAGLDSALPTSMSDIDSLLELIQGHGDFDVKASVEGNINKYHFSTKSIDLSKLMSLTNLGSDFDCYFVFDSNILTGAQVSFKYSTDSVLDANANVEAKVSIEKFDGEINYPSFDGYKSL